MSKILFISMCLPFEKARNAGAKTFNFYINSFANDPHNEVMLISKVLPDEEEFVKNVTKKIKVYTVSTPKNPIKKYFSYFKSFNSKFNPYYKYGKNKNSFIGRYNDSTLYFIEKGIISLYHFSD